jgi:hypothetical protein
MADNNEDWQDVPLDSSAQAPSADGWEDVSLNHIDEISGEEVPVEFSGNSPETAINKSPLSAMDRLKLSMGNEAGNIGYLQEKFEDVKPITGPDGQPTKELAVLNAGKWHRVDPGTGEITDPWKLAKQYVKSPSTLVSDAASLAGEYMENPAELAGDLADMGPIGLGTAVAASPAVGALGAAGTGVAGIAAAAGAGTAMLRTSLGRIVGTYDATPVEQTWDVAFETLMNAGAAKVIDAGVKPSAKYVASKIDDLAAKFKDVVPDSVKGAAEAVANSPKAMFKKIFAGLSVGEDNFDTAVQNPAALKAVMNNTHAKAGNNVSLYHDEITGQQVGEIRTIAENAQGIMSQIYGKMKTKILDSVSPNFTANLDDVIQESYKKSIKSGFGRIIVGEGSAERVLTGTVAEEYMAKMGMKGARFDLLSQKEMTGLIKDGAALGDELGFLAQDKEAYGLIRDFYNRLSVFRNAKSLSGREAAERLLDFKKVGSDIARALSESEKAQALPGVKRILDEARNGMDNKIFSQIKDSGAGEGFKALNQTYSQLSEEFAPLNSAVRQFKKSQDTKVFEGLLNKFLSRPGKNSSQKFAIDAAIDAAESNELGFLANTLKGAKTRIQVGEAAKAFNPLNPSGMKSGTFRASMGLWAAQQAVTGNPTMAVALAGGAMLSSPATAKAGVALTQGLMKGQQYLANLPKSQLAKFLDSPEAVAMYTNAVLQVPVIRSEVQGQLNSVIEGSEQ